MRIVYMGTPEFAVPTLKRLLRDGHAVTLAVTQPDKPKGRGMKYSHPPVKSYALAHGIPVYQPSTLRTAEATATIAAANPEIIIVAAYGKILPSAILELPPRGCVCVHASLLPKYRGAAPIQWAVINGESESGITLMQMDEGIDTGGILRQTAIPIEGMTGGQLHDALAELGATLLGDTLPQWESGNLIPQKQDDAAASYAPMLDKKLGCLCFKDAAQTLANRIRGLDPWPGACCVIGTQICKVFRAKVGENSDKQPGEIVRIIPFTVACGDKSTLEIGELQAQGGRRMTAEEYLRGHPIEIGAILQEIER